MNAPNSYPINNVSKSLLDVCLKEYELAVELSCQKIDQTFQLDKLDNLIVDYGKFFAINAMIRKVKSLELANFQKERRAS
jgi:hypothetical protein